MHGIPDWQLWALSHPAELLVGVVGGVVSVLVLLMFWLQRKGRK